MFRRLPGAAASAEGFSGDRGIACILLTWQLAGSSIPGHMISPRTSDNVVVDLPRVKDERVESDSLSLQPVGH